MAAVALLLFVAIAVIPVAASVWPNYQQIYVKPENGIRFDKVGNGTYYFKLTGGGLNALHISNDPINATFGQVTTTTSTTGHFWMTDTGGRGFDDDAILLVGVNGTPDTAFKVHITSSGYTWAPTGVVNQLPAIGDISYTTSAVNNAQFTTTNFTEFSGSDVNTYWRPSTSSYYPVVSGEKMTDSLNDFKFIPIDLKVGIIGTNANSTYNGSLTDHGAARIDYVIEGMPLDGIVAFNAYAWCNQSNQLQGVSWTNAVNKSTDGPGSNTYSGWAVTN